MLWDAVSYLSIKGRELIGNALKWAEQLHRGQMRDSGHHYFIHAVAVAIQTAEWCAESVVVIAAAVLHDCIEDSSINVDELEKLFGKDIAFLVDGCTKIRSIKDAKLLSVDISRTTIDDREATDSLAIVKVTKYGLVDPRVFVIKLMDRYHNMLTLDHVTDEKRSRKAEETMRFYVPLAKVLGMNEFARALETLCFQFIDPEAYEQARDIIFEMRAERES